MKSVNKMSVFTPLLIIIFLFCCSSGNPFDESVVLRVKKSDYVNKISVTGIIEATKTYTVTAPMIWSDMTITHLIPEGTYIDEQDTVCILNAGELENNYKEAVKNLETKKSEHNISIADYNLQNLLMLSQLQTIQSSTAIANLDSSKLLFSTSGQRKILELQMQKAETEMAKIQKKLDYSKIINLSKLKKIEMEIKQEENNVARQDEQLNKLILKSHTAGMVTYGRLWSTGKKVKEGDIVWPRMPIIKIPNLSEMQIKLTVNETHFKRIEKEQHVDITIDAFPEITLTGQIINKTPMGKPLREGSRVKVFEIFTSIDSTGFSIQPGLSITCDVILESISDTIVVPLSAVFEKDSTKIVYIYDDDEYRSQTVKIAGKSESYAVIAEGLNLGEEILLIEPPAHLIAEGSL